MHIQLTIKSGPESCNLLVAAQTTTEIAALATVIGSQLLRIIREQAVRFPTSSPRILIECQADVSLT